MVRNRSGTATRNKRRRVAGTAGNLTTISSDGWLHMGLILDPAAVTDPDGLRRNIEDAYTALLEAGGVVSD